MNSIDPKLKIFFLFILIIYSILLVNLNYFGPNESVNKAYFISISQNYNCNFFNEITYNRFSPLGCYWESFLVSILSTPRLFFVVNLVYTLLIFLYLYYFLKEVKTKYKKSLFLLLILIILSPALLINITELRTIEDEVAAMLVIFLISYRLYSIAHNWVFILLCIISANILLYLKEPLFLSLLMFSFLSLYKNKDIPQKKLIYSLLISILIFIALYFYSSFYGISGVDYSNTINNDSKVIHYFKLILNYAFFSDPFIFLIIIPYSIYRFFILIKKNQAISFEDICLFSGLSYLLVFLFLGIYGPYYLLPSYIFFIPTLVSLFNYQLLKYKISKLFFLTCITIGLLNSIPYSIYIATYQIQNARNFNLAINFIKNYINNDKSNIVSLFIGDTEHSTSGNYYLLYSFLNFHHLNSNKYDLKSFNNVSIDEGKPLFINLEVNNPDNFSFGAHSKSIFLKPTVISNVQAGDMIIFGPFSGNFAEIPPYYFDETNYQKFLFKSQFVMYDLSLKNLLKSIITDQKNSFSLIKNNKINVYPLYTVFIKK